MNNQETYIRRGRAASAPLIHLTERQGFQLEYVDEQVELGNRPERDIQIYTVRFPIGGRKTLMSGRVMSSGYIPPVSSNRARRNRLSELYIVISATATN